MISVETIPTGDRAAVEWACSSLPSNVSKAKIVRSGDESRVYEISAPEQRWFLKLASNLGQEKDSLCWLLGRVPVPTVVGFLPTLERDALLTTGLDGIDLAHLSATWQADKIVRCLALALRQFHSTDISNFEFGSPPPGAVLVHGDACLPNLLFLPDGTLSGFVDCGHLRAGRVEDDLSAAVWSLQHNIGVGYGVPFLIAYGIADADETMANALRLNYESAQLNAPMPTGG